MKTQIILYNRPLSAGIELTYLPGDGDWAFGTPNPNTVLTQNLITTIRAENFGSEGLEIDLYDDVAIPMTFSILDIREPEKRRTTWSKTIKIPGTANNSRIFTHIYEISSDGWVTIGGVSVYEGFNPNLRKECVVMNGGVQVMKGNLQLKKITKDRGGNIEYEIGISGDLTSLFYDVGLSKISDLDLSEWNHYWTKPNIEATWAGISKKSNGSNFTSISKSSTKQISRLARDADSGRLRVMTTSPHGFSVGDNVNIDPFLGTFAGIRYSYLYVAKGDFVVVDVKSTVEFVVNYFYPIALLRTGSYVITPNSYVHKTLATGRGYTYPLISWGEEYDYNSFPVTSMVPSFYVKTIFDKIMESTGSKYTSNFLNSQFFKRLIFTQRKNDYELSDSELEKRRFCVGLLDDYEILASAELPSNFYYPIWDAGLTSVESTKTYVPFEKETGLGATVSFYDSPGSDGAISNWNESTNKWVVRETGEYNLSANIQLSAWIDMDGYVGGLANGTASFTPLLANYEYKPGAFFGNPSGPLGEGECGIYISVKIMRKRSGFVEEIGTGQKSFNVNRNSTWTALNPNWPYFGRYQPASWEDLMLNIPSTKTYFAKNDEVWVELSSYVQAKSGSWSNSETTGVAFHERYLDPLDATDTREILGNFWYSVKASSFIINDPSPTVGEGGLLEAKNILPKDLTCKDFLLSIIKMFNLHIDSDKSIEKLYNIEPRDDYYKDGSGGATDYVDWSDKVDYDSVDIIPMGELITKYYTFSNREENDYWNTKFKSDRGRPYSKYTKEVQNDFIGGETKIQIPLGTTVMINNPEGSDIVMPSIVQKESTGAQKPVTNPLPRILLWGGIKPYTTGRGAASIDLTSAGGASQGWELLSDSNILGLTSSQYKYYPYAGTVDSPTDPWWDINWYNMEEGDFVYWDNSRWSNENLYNRYWSTFIDEISDPASKVIRCRVNLTSSDIWSLDFRKIYLIDGNYLRLQKISDYDPVSETPPYCEFLKLKSGSKFKKRSVITNANGYSGGFFETLGLSVGLSTGRTNDPGVRQVAPRKKRLQGGYQNTTPGSNLSNTTTVTTRGLSNYVGGASSNISITGNENAVGSGSSNISISGGNGNYVSGNVKNVNMIGTDKKYVNESDVTYINGIRYKNGVAISKSNVINGGTDEAQVKQSGSTTINVINAGEDIVINSGSRSYENVINSGRDTILPDLKELGISTTTNPNPRTNLSGTYNSSTGTQSVSDFVRRVDQYRSLS